MSPPDSLPAGSWFRLFSFAPCPVRGGVYNLLRTTQGCGRAAAPPPSPFPPGGKMENLFRTSQVRSMDDLPLLPGNTAPHPPRPAPSRASPGSLYCTSSYTGILSILVHHNSSCTLSSCLYPFNSLLPSVSRISLSSLADLSRPLRTLRRTSCLSPYSRAFRSASTLKQPGAPVGESHIAFSAPSLIATPSLSRYLTSSPVPCAPTYFEVVVVPFSFFILDITILVSRPWGTPRPVFLPVSYMIVRGLIYAIDALVILLHPSYMTTSLARRAV